MRRPSILMSYHSQGQERVNLSVLVIGCAGVGKTLLVRHLKLKYGECHTPTRPSSPTMNSLKVDTNPTNGVDLSTITYHNINITFREVGSTLLTKWPAYYEESALILYIIDSANMIQIPSSWIELLNVLSHKSMKEKAVLIAMNKSDISDQTSVTTLKSIMRMDDILQKATCRTGVVNVSALTGMNFDTLLQNIVSLGAPQAAASHSHT